MARFTYYGPVQTIPLATGRTRDQAGNQVSKFEDIDLKPGRETLDLPENNPIIASMIDRQLLVPVKSVKATKSDATTQGVK